MENNSKGNYSAFYVAEPFKPSNLGPRVAHDFCYYNMLGLWKSMDSSFPFEDSHMKTYNVRDNSQWETLKSRLHKRLTSSKNIILFLSSETKHSNALNEEIEYGVGTLKLPVIVVYPELKNSDIVNEGQLNEEVLKPYWDKLPTFRDLMTTVATFHIPFEQKYVRSALMDPDVSIESTDNTKLNKYYYIDEVNE